MLAQRNFRRMAYMAISLSAVCGLSLTLFGAPSGYAAFASGPEGVIAAASAEIDRSTLRGASAAEEAPGVAGDLFASDPSILPQGALARLGYGALRSMAFSPDNGYVAIGSSIGVHLYRAGSFEELWTRLTEKPIEGVAASSGGAWLATTSKDGVTIWNGQTGEDLYLLGGRSVPALRAVFQPKGTLLATAGESEAKIWDVATGQMIAQRGFLAAVSDLAWSPDGKSLSIGAGHIILWQMGTDETDELISEDAPAVARVAWSPDGSTIAAGLLDGSTQIWDLKARQPRTTAGALKQWVTSMAFSGDGALLATGGHRGDLEVFDVRTGEKVGEFAGHVGDVVGLAMASDGRTLVSGALDSRVVIWDVPTGNRLEEFKAHVAPLDCVAWSGQGSWIAAGGMDGKVRIWDVRTGQLQTILDAHSTPVKRLVWAPDGSHLVSLPEGAEAAKVWDVTSGNSVYPLEPPAYAGMDEEAYMPDGGKITSDVDTAPLDAAFSPDGKLLVTGGEDTRVIVWDLTTGEPLHVMEGHTLPVYSVAFLAEGLKIASMSLDGTLIYWDAATGEKLDEAQHLGMSSLIVSPDEATLALGAWEGGMILWDAATDAQRAALEGSNEALVRPQFSGNGMRLATGSKGDVTGVTVWDVAEGKMTQGVNGHTIDVRGVAFSPDGSVLATASWDGTVLFWNVQ